MNALAINALVMKVLVMKALVMKALVAVVLAIAQFAIATAPYQFHFPRDHAAHFAYASEWWYFTGHLRARDGQRFGYELTIFRFGLRPGKMTIAPGESRWHGSEVYPAHFAITDASGRRFTHVERFERTALGMAGASDVTLDVHSGNWSIRGTNPIQLSAGANGDALELQLRTAKPPAINGEGGISRKGPCRSCASHYYSMTRLQSAGTLTVAGLRRQVEGVSWMDHEYGSDELQGNQSGWDWFALQLDDGRELMLYRLRQKDGSITPESSGSLVQRDGTVRHLRLADFSAEQTGTWTSPHTHARYPSGWRVRVPAAGIDVVVTPLVADQELIDPQIGVAYWEGDCDVAGVDGGHPVHGVSYVELTGYAGDFHV